MAFDVFSLYSFILGILISFNMYMNAVKQKQTAEHDLKKHILLWMLSLIWSLIPVNADVYVPAGM